MVLSTAYSKELTKLFDIPIAVMHRADYYPGTIFSFNSASRLPREIPDHPLIPRFLCLLISLTAEPQSGRPSPLSKGSRNGLNQLDNTLYP
jgi:hypothetical protein